MKKLVITTGIFLLLLRPDMAGQQNADTLAALKYGKGRVVILGEAGMLTAQVAGKHSSKMGMNAPVGRQNLQFVLNLMHWLSGLLD